ncbi:MAG: hypothetical protein AB1489_36825 [Acidobacteriota bacterium]
MDTIWAWLIAFVLIILVFWGLIRENNRVARRTVEEYEADVRARRIGRNLLMAGLLALETHFKPNLKVAMEYSLDEKKGQTRTKKNGDNDDNDNEEKQDPLP